MEKVILVLPGELLRLEVGQSFLDRQSFKIRAARSAEHAFEVAAAWKPSLILFSSRLEGTTPRDFCQKLRTRKDLAGMKLVMLTDQVPAAQDDQVPPEVDLHLVSPIDARQLLRTLAALLEVRERRAPRVATSFLSSISGFLHESDEPPTWSWANILNLSEVGIVLEANVVLDVGARGTVVFVLPGTAERLTGEGVICYVRDEVQLHYAVDFSLPAPETRKAIRDFVQRTLLEDDFAGGPGGGV